MNLNMKCAIGILINFRDGRGGEGRGFGGYRAWYTMVVSMYVIVHMQIDQFIQVNLINF